MKGLSFIEVLMRFGSKAQSEKNNTQGSLFGMGNGFELQKPEIPKAEEWSKLEKLNKEREVIGIYLSAHPLDDYRLEIENFCNTTLAEMKDLPSLNGRDITIAGMVTSAKVLTSKNGNYYGRLTIEDYTDSWELVLFGKDFENFRKFFFEGYFIMVKGKVQPRTYGTPEPEFKVKSINMLSDVKDEMIKTLTLTLPIEEIDEPTIAELKKQVEKNKGKIQLKVKVIDQQEQMAVDLFSRTMRINITPGFIGYLQSNEYEFKLKD